MTYKNKLAFGMLAATAVIVAPMTVEASTLTLTPDNVQKPYTNVAINFNIPALADTVFVSYQWYLVSSGTETPIAGATDSILPVKSSYSGKTLKVVAWDEHGNAYTGHSFVEQLQPAFAHDKPAIFDNASTSTTPIDTALPADTLKAGHTDIIDLSSISATIPATDVTYTYQWYKASASGASEKINGATNETYTIPASLLANESLMYITVEVTARVGDDPTNTTLIRTALSNKIEITEEPLQEIRDDIDALRLESNNDYYMYTQNLPTSITTPGLDGFIEHVAQIQARYDELTASSKATITNARILQKAQSDITNIQQFITLMTTIENNGIPQEGAFNYAQEFATFKDNVTQADALFQTLDQLELSLLEYDTNHTTLISDLLAYKAEAFAGESYTSTVAMIESINDDIDDLFTINDDGFRAAYRLPLAELQTEITAITEQYPLINTRYHALLEKTAIANAQKDLRAVNSFKTKAVRVSDATTFTRQDIDNAKTALAAYIKLTPLQKSLVTNEELTKLLNAIKQEQATIDNIILLINNLTATDDTDRPIYALDGAPIGPRDLAIFESHVNAIMTAYNNLSAVSKKFIPNYLQLKEAVQSIKESKRVNRLILELNQHNPEERYNRAKAKLQTAQKAFMKLSLLEQSIVFEKQALIDYADLVQSVNVDAPPEEAEIVITMIDNDLPILAGDDAYSSYGDLDTFVGFEAVVSQTNSAYRSLASKHRRSVTNALAVQTAVADIRAVNATIKKMNAAEAAIGDLAKEFSRLTTVERAYYKMSAAQQTLLQLPYTLDQDDEETDQVESPYSQFILQKTQADETITQLNERIDALITVEGELSSTPLWNNVTDEEMTDVEDEIVYLYEEYYNDSYSYDMPLSEIHELEQGYKDLGPSLQKYIVDKPRLTAAIKDAKLVESFMSKVNKLPASPSVEQKQAILTAFDKLTSMQVSLLVTTAAEDEDTTGVYDKVIQFEQDINAVNTETTQLTSIIDRIVVNEKYSEGFYHEIPSDVDISDFKTAIAQIKAYYERLTPAQKRLIFNYSVVTQAEKDIALAQKLIDTQPLDPTVDDTPWREELSSFNTLTLSAYHLLLLN